MFQRDQYQLIDFGDGRKLERFGAYVLDRPSPAAESADRRSRDTWSTAAARFERRDGAVGAWTKFVALDQPWTICHAALTLTLKLTEFGHLGIFPEQSDNWDWIAAQVKGAGRPLVVLNLFGYTGACTLAAAAAGAAVTHVDAAAPAVAWARSNADASGLGDAPIRWITDDALKFVRREVKRGRRYDAIVLDPPGYGHGPHGEVWKLEADLPGLWELCHELLAPRAEFLLLTCHSGELGCGVPLLKRVLELEPRLGRQGHLQGQNMTLRSAAGGDLHSGATVRWSRREAATRE